MKKRRKIRYRKIWVDNDTYFALCKISHKHNCCVTESCSLIADFYLYVLSIIDEPYIPLKCEKKLRDGGF